GLAPEPIARVTIGAKPGLIYTHVAGTIGAPAHLLGQALARLHRVRDWSGLRRLPRAGARTGETLVAHLPGGMALTRLRPPRRVVPPAADVLLHGDPVPSNVVTTPRGITFIDWQCPALGPPEEDLFLALSPGMAHVYGQAPAALDALLDGYGSDPVARRLRARLPELHWRMACYCHLRASEGAAGYAAARDIEIRALKQAR
ncbi:MAG: phosphotransferase, partial [Pseudomonadota bacterium]